MDWECVRIALRLHNFYCTRRLRTTCPECYQRGCGVVNNSTCIRMISQRYKSGTISTPEGGAVVNGALLDSDKSSNNENRNSDEQDV